mgnify:CR=1 FL=1
MAAMPILIPFYGGNVNFNPFLWIKILIPFYAVFMPCSFYYRQSRYLPGGGRVHLLVHQGFVPHARHLVPFLHGGGRRGTKVLTLLKWVNN